jgi:hypothetical protein
MDSLREKTPTLIMLHQVHARNLNQEYQPYNMCEHRESCHISRFHPFIANMVWLKRAKAMETHVPNAFGLTQPLPWPPMHLLFSFYTSHQLFCNHWVHIVIIGECELEITHSESMDVRITDLKYGLLTRPWWWSISPSIDTLPNVFIHNIFLYFGDHDLPSKV